MFSIEDIDMLCLGVEMLSLEDFKMLPPTGILMDVEILPEADCLDLVLLFPGSRGFGFARAAASRRPAVAPASAAVVSRPVVVSGPSAGVGVSAAASRRIAVPRSAAARRPAAAPASVATLSLASAAVVPRPVFVSGPSAVVGVSVPAPRPKTVPCFFTPERLADSPATRTDLAVVHSSSTDSLVAMGMSKPPAIPHFFACPK
ncbi:hypothetical protein BD408DRAFT_407586 [Parasitella parasitica]|nr:hypothetical protein BD408DRAFT_407586 [Parasitella parasitica]